MSSKLQAELAENFHLVTIPLMLLATATLGFMLVYLKEVLVPFVIGVFLVYLLKPWVRIISQPCMGFRAMQRCLRQRSVGYTSLPTTQPGSDVAQYKRDAAKPVCTERSAAGDGAAPADGASVASYHTGLPIATTAIDIGSGSAADTRKQGPPLTGRLRSNSFPRGENKYSHERQMHLPSRNKGDQDDTCRCPYWLAVLVTLACFGGTVCAMFLLVLGSIEAFKEEGLGLYLQQAALVSNTTLSWLYDGWGIEADQLLINYMLEMPVAALARDFMLYVFGLFMNMFLVLLVTFYLIFDEGASQGSLYAQVDEQIQKYIGLKSTISGVAAVLVFLVFKLLPVRLAYFFSLITFLLNFIPNAGPVLATFLPTPIIVFDPELPFGNMLLALVVPGAIHFMVGNVVEPAIFGASMELHPVVVLLSLTLWYALWGVTGAILAVPLVAVLRIIVSHNSHPYARVVLRILTGAPSPTAIHKV